MHKNKISINSKGFEVNYLGAITIAPKCVLFKKTLTWLVWGIKSWKLYAISSEIPYTFGLVHLLDSQNKCTWK